MVATDRRVNEFAGASIWKDVPMQQSSRTTAGRVFVTAFLLAAMMTMPVAQAQVNAGGVEVITNGPQTSSSEGRSGWSASHNVADSERYEALVRSNPNFRAARERKECGPINDPQMHAECVASFGR
jgi:hypothetical protein